MTLFIIVLKKEPFGLVPKTKAGLSARPLLQVFTSPKPFSIEV